VVTDAERKTVADAISALLLSDHMGDAHEAGITLAKMLWGGEGAEAYVAYVESEEPYQRDPMKALLAPVIPEIWGGG
jgi:hypothetical protein